MLKNILFIALGGALGSVLRYLSTIVLEKYLASIFPWATFIVNTLGCLLIGVFIGLLEKNQLTDTTLRWFLITGFCGGYTTFSAFGYENFTLFNNQNAAMAFLYIGVSVFLGLFAVWLGLFITK